MTPAAGPRTPNPATAGYGTNPRAATKPSAAKPSAATKPRAVAKAATKPRAVTKAATKPRRRQPDPNKAWARRSWQCVKGAVPNAWPRSGIS